MTTKQIGSHRSCRKCGAPSGSYNYCRAHRKENAKKAQKQRQNSKSRSRGGYRAFASTAPGSCASFPVASASFYDDRARAEAAEALAVAEDDARADAQLKAGAPC